MRRTLLTAILCFVLTGSARAQLVVGTDAPIGDAAWLIDVTTGSADPLWSGVPVYGLAADDANQVIYSCGPMGLFSWAYNSSLPPVLLGPVTLNGSPLLLVGLAFASGKLYGVTNGTTVYEVDPATQAATLILTGPSPLALGGLAYNPVDGLFYAASDAGLPPGIYSLDLLGAGTVSLVAPYPLGQVDVDGCAVGDNKVFLIEDEPTPIAVFDLATGTYGTPIPTPITTTNVWSAGAWAPSLKIFGKPTVYCTAKTNSLGCVPSISVMGASSATASSGFVVQGSNVRNQKVGVLLYTLSGRDVVPFQGGVLCLAGPIYRTPARSSGGSHYIVKDCTGTWRIDMNAFAAQQFRGNPKAGLSQPGNFVHCQWWGRDPGDALGTSLTDALQYAVGP